MKKDLVARRVGVSDIIDLRHSELRQGQPIQTAHFEGDEDPNTYHFSVSLVDFPDEIIGCASFMMSTVQDQPAWELRGMATQLAWQGLGVGRFLLAFAEATLIRESPVQFLWCTARASAVGFYEKLGWQYISEIFEVPNVGPHRKMMKRIR